MSLSTFHNIEAIGVSRERTANLISTAEDLLSQVRDAETGQRGFLISGNERFLEPYHAVRLVVVDTFQTLRRDNLSKTGNANLNTLEPLISEKMTELDRLIVLRKTGKEEEAISALSAGYGKRLMDEIRAQIAKFVREQNEVLRLEELAFQSAMRSLFAIILGASAFIVGFVLLFTYVVYREWKQREQSKFSSRDTTHARPAVFNEPKAQ